MVGSAASSYLPAPEQHGTSLLVPGVRKGRAVGTISVLDDGGRLSFCSEIRVLSLDLPEDPQVARLVDEFYAARQAQLLATEPALAGPANAEPPLPDLFTPKEAAVIRARGLLVAGECGRCHEKQLAQWQRTPHANAVEVLEAAGRLVPECLACHSEAARRGQLFDRDGADRFGVDCAACHGAGLYHASTSGGPDSIVARPSRLLCVRCHDEEHSGNFEYRVYLRQVRH